MAKKSSHKTIANNGRSSLKHRFSQLLLSSSCTAGTVDGASTTTTTKLIKHSSNNIISSELVDQLDYEENDKEHKCYSTRCKVDRPRRIAPVVKISVDCGGSADAALQPLLLNSKKSKHERKANSTDENEELQHRQASMGEGRMKCCPPANCSPYSSLQCSYKAPSRRSSIMTMSCNNKKMSRNSNCTRNLNSIAKEARKLLSNSNSSSFDISENDGDEDDESWTTTTATTSLLSSKSFSSDSSEFYQTNKKSRNKSTRRCRKRVIRPRKRDRLVGHCRPSMSLPSHGLAVVKRSSDPYMDFRSSMVEMIVERELRSERELERLLKSYLAINSDRHYDVIVEAFADIWEAIFGKYYSHHI